MHLSSREPMHNSMFVSPHQWKAALVAGKRIRIQLQRTGVAAPPKPYSAAPQPSPEQPAQGAGERLARLHTVFRELHGRG